MCRVDKELKITESSLRDQKPLKNLLKYYWQMAYYHDIYHDEFSQDREAF